ncbi:hypothetical protein JW848_03685 [Candidatus Bipolaricaulota bacterium]|nr:hypothetical protein [Candidatus Bipolaricaulota bacterium]
MKHTRTLHIFVVAARNFLILGFPAPLIQALHAGRSIEQVVTRWGERIIL